MATGMEPTVMEANGKAPELSPVPRASSMVVSDTIIVKVGVEEKKYTLHKKLLLHHSEYFRGALSGNFKETDDGVVPLGDVDLDVFDIFVDWLYEKKLPECIKDRMSKYGEITIRLRTYVLADRLLAPKFKTAVFDHIFRWYKTGYPPYYVITFVFNNLMENGPLLQFLIDVFCTEDGIGEYPGHFDVSKEIPDLPKEAFVRLFMKMHAIKGLSKEEKKVKRGDYEI